MPLFEIGHKTNGSILFSLEATSKRLCVQTAVSNGANLSGADLRGAYLYGANLSGANLSGAKIIDDITVTKAPIQISGLYWPVTIWDEHLQIGCELHSHEEWRNYSDDEWLKMGGKEALYLKRKQFPAIIALCDQHKSEEKE